MRVLQAQELRPSDSRMLEALGESYDKRRLPLKEESGLIPLDQEDTVQELLVVVDS